MNERVNPGWELSRTGKESACNTGDPSLIPGSGRSAGEGTQQAAMMAMTMIAAPVDNPLSMMSLARRLQQRAMMPGTERSMPAEQMANVMPAAPTATHDALNSTLNNWSGCTIFVLMQANTMAAMMKMMKMPYFSATAQMLVDDLFMVVASHAKRFVACGALHDQLLVEVLLL